MLYKMCEAPPAALEVNPANLRWQMADKICQLIKAAVSNIF